MSQIKALANLKEASGRIKVDGDSIEGVLTLISTDGDKVEMSLDTFDDIYSSFVKVWPVIKPLKQELATKRAEAKSAAREAAKQEEKEKKEAARQEKVAAREKAKAEKEAAKKKAPVIDKKKAAAAFDKLQAKKDSKRSGK